MTSPTGSWPLNPLWPFVWQDIWQGVISMLVWSCSLCTAEKAHLGMSGPFVSLLCGLLTSDLSSICSFYLIYYIITLDWYGCNNSNPLLLPLIMQLQYNFFLSRKSVEPTILIAKTAFLYANTSCFSALVGPYQVFLWGRITALSWVFGSIVLHVP